VVLAIIGQLGKLGRFEIFVDIFSNLKHKNAFNVAREPKTVAHP